jgi:hypothetical protein
MKQLAAIAFLGLWSWTAQAQNCVINTPGTEPLLANGSIPAGVVMVSNDQVNLYVTVATTGDFTISRLDVAVATTLAGIPQSGGQPNLSQFPYRQTFSPEVTSHTFPIPLGTITFGTTVYVAAHASLDSRTQGHQQAWGAGTLFPCSQACTSGGGGCEGDDGSHINGGDGGGDGGGDCHHGDGAHALAQHGVGIFDDGHGGQQQCGGGGGDDHGDHQSVSPLGGNGGGGEGDNSCSGGGEDDHGGDQAHRRSASHLNGGSGDGGGDGGGDQHSGGSSDCTAGCGATYFTYVVNCVTIGE